MGPASGPGTAEKPPRTRGRCPWAPQAPPGSQGGTRGPVRGAGRGPPQARLPDAAAGSPRPQAAELPAEPQPHRHPPPLRSPSVSAWGGPQVQSPAVPTTYPPGGSLSSSLFSPPESGGDAPSAVVLGDIKASWKPGLQPPPGECGRLSVGQGPLAGPGRLDVSLRDNPRPVKAARPPRTYRNPVTRWSPAPAEAGQKVTPERPQLRGWWQGPDARLSQRSLQQEWQVTPPIPPSPKRRLGEGPGLPPDLHRRAVARTEAPTPFLRPRPPEERDAGDLLSLSVTSGEARMGGGVSIFLH